MRGSIVAPVDRAIQRRAARGLPISRRTHNGSIGASACALGRIRARTSRCTILDCQLIGVADGTIVIGQIAGALGRIVGRTWGSRSLTGAVASHADLLLHTIAVVATQT